MPNWCDFNVAVTGPCAERKVVEDLVRSLPADKGVTDLSEFLADCDDADGNSHQTWFDRSTIEATGERLEISGGMAWAPPVLLIEKLAQMFPSLTFDCFSTTEHEWYEHWRVSGNDSELIEDVLYDILEDEIHIRYLKQGEESNFDRVDTELSKMEQAVEQIVGRGRGAD